MHGTQEEPGQCENQGDSLWQGHLTPPMGPPGPLQGPGLTTEALLCGHMCLGKGEWLALPYPTLGSFQRLVSVSCPTEEGALALCSLSEGGLCGHTHGGPSRDSGPVSEAKGKARGITWETWTL